MFRSHIMHTPTHMHTTCTHVCTHAHTSHTHTHQHTSHTHTSTHTHTTCRVPSGHMAAPPTVIMDRPGETEEEDGQFVVEDTANLTPPTMESFLEGVSDKPEGQLEKIYQVSEVEVWPVDCRL